MLDVSSLLRSNGEGDREAVEGLLAASGAVSRARVQRRRLTPPEARLWVALRGRTLDGAKFRRQHPVGVYVLDFYCAEAKLCIEVDGLVHGEADQARKDQVRDAWLERQGIRVVRIAAEDVRVNLDGVVDWIGHVVKDRRAD